MDTATTPLDLALTASGLEADGQLVIREALSPFYAQAAEWQAKIATVTEPTVARASRLLLKKIRVEAGHKKDELKAALLVRTRAIDAAFKTIEATIAPMEATLDAIEAKAKKDRDLAAAYWKSVPKQTLLKENGEFGDCVRCCIAAIINVPALEVPHFARDYGSSWDSEAQRWLNERGWTMIEVLHKAPVALNIYASEKTDFPVMACGPTVRSNTPQQQHAVVNSASWGRTIYDPHPSEAGLLAVAQRYLIVKAWTP